MTCERSTSGILDLYFYDELTPAERDATSAHLASCAQCRQALDDLAVISRALASRPAIAAPPGGDWTGFMARLDAAIDVETRTRGSNVVAFPLAPTAAAPRSRGAARYLAVAATLALATGGLTYIAATSRPAPVATAALQTRPAEASPVAAGLDSGEGVAATSVASMDPAARTAFTQLSGQHFGRSKLVVLGMANKDAASAQSTDWQYERQLASSLLTDTRLYRAAAEANGMASLASILADLELVLLQTSMAQESSRDDLEQIQRLIRKRDLVTKMNVVVTTGL
jgi:hypothetical protein